MAATLVVMPSVSAVPQGNSFFLDRKAVTGLKLYAQLWPGPVRCLFRVGARESIAFGQSFAPADLPFEIMTVEDHPSADHEAFADAAIVLAAGDSHLDLDLADELSAPVVYIIEYTLNTRLRIIRLNRGLTFRTLRAALWEIMTERRRRRAFSRAAGLQCNGTPAYDAYSKSVPDALLYFDTRTTDAQQVNPETLAAKKATMLRHQPLRLAFSGRLDPMKGADHLVPVAVALTRQGVPFTLDIFGDGALRASIDEQVAAANIGDRVKLHGPVSFEDVLMPTLAREIDLFLCCHRQGDPSCTYTETLSCGVPIVGYANAAFGGIIERSDVGVAVKMDDVEAMAGAIRRLNSDRDRLALLADNAAQFGREHSFEREFAKRIAQLERIAAR